MRGKPLRTLYRTVLSACAAETNLQIGEFPPDETSDMGIHQRIYAAEEFEDFPVVLQEFDHLGIHSGELSVIFKFSGIIDCPAIEYISSAIARSVGRNAFFIGEAIYPDL